MGSSRSTRDRERDKEKLDRINQKTGRNMPQAIATAALLVVVILACLFVSADLFALLVVVFMVLALWELRVDLAVIGLKIPIVTLWICCTLTLAASFYSADHLVALGVCTLASAVVVMFVSSLQVSLGGGAERAASRKMLQDGRMASELAVPEHPNLTQVAVALFTLLYIAVLGSTILISLTFNDHYVSHAIVVVFMPALSDTGGLVFGAWFGKHKLSPRISPKKSVEGLLGSILFAMAGAFIVFACTYDGAMWATRWWVPIVEGVLIGVVGTFGDLCASMLKRDIGIKDMGHMLKGHGGVLDRVDSILMCAPFVCGLLYVCGM
ncbi:phosphatidate cytidylyltransferase [Bifidobacterium choloepi]|uniref:Phosphatidate cytidylyltransferase n=1 Tax=Bifidobacterium choloepi TaxID=2614131 RepID=A0A6I5MWY5_9BIFI|nr:phosphatidate cytidylyltransferase [Bifidobacterium choloepi]NEG69068.1 phosphatidate cytidylyltransferase [Bifidobacterium choloepi]